MNRFLFMMIGLFWTGMTLVAIPANATVRDLSPAEYSSTIDLFMHGRLGEADARLQALADTCAGQPLYLLAKARVQLESFSMDDDDREFTKEVSAPALALLDEVIAHCDEGLDGGDDESQELQLRFYRGWAWMMKSQIKALGRNFYSAGRDAGKGKGDLEYTLEVKPDKAISNGLLGAFLYFTDAVPKLFQFLSKLLFLPTGDRERGLAMIEKAANGDSPAKVDYELLLANVVFFFEGRFEEGLQMTGDLLTRYPRYPRLALAYAMAGPLDPLNGAARLTTADETVDRLVNEDGIDSASLWTVRAFLGWSLRYRAGHGQARAKFEDIATSAPAHPDWVESFARLQLAQIEAAEGRHEVAREQAFRVLGDERNTRFHEQARKLLYDLEEAGAPPAPFDVFLVATVYAAGPDSLALLAPRFDDIADHSIRAAFYAAECRLLAGDSRAAARGFRAVHAMKASYWDETYRMLAAARVAEISGLAGNYRTAANWMGRAAESHQDIFRLDWLLEGRQRYFQELDKNGQAWPPPTLFAPAP